MNVGISCGAWSWAIFQGSHIPNGDWDALTVLSTRGVRSVKYLLYEGSPETQFEDIRRLRQERNYSEIVLRLMHPHGQLPETAGFVAQYERRIQHAFDMGFSVVLQPLNEPNLENTSMSWQAIASWFVSVANKLRSRFPRAEIVSPPIAPFAPNTWEAWDSLRACVDVSDTVGVHVYWRSLADADGAYSLPWWLGQVPGKVVRVLECGCPTGTDAATRQALLPRLYSQLAAEPRCWGYYPFILSAEDAAQHGEHFLTQADLTALGTLAGGGTVAPPTLPPLLPPPPPSLPLPGDVPSIPVGGIATYRVVVERIS